MTITKQEHINTLVKMRMAKLNKGIPTTDTFTDRTQHQKVRDRMFVQQEMMPIYLVLNDILEELKKLNAK